MEFRNVAMKNGGSEDPNWDGMLNDERSSSVPESMPRTQLLMVNVRIENSATHGLDLQANTSFDAASKDVVVTGSKKSAMIIGAEAAGSIPTGDYNGNTDAWFTIDTSEPNIAVDTTWKDRGIPYALSSNGMRVRKQGGSAALTLCVSANRAAAQPLPLRPA
jgi:hypothetical protein